MNRKSLRRISIATTREAEDAVAELLSGMLGAPASSYYDTETDISTVSVYFQRRLPSPHELCERISAGLKHIKSCGLKTGSGKIVIASMRHEDWADSWKRHFKPIEIIRGKARYSGRNLPHSLLIKPSWNKHKPCKGQTVIILDPGLSFGTGHHPTTAYCLGEIVRSADRRHVRAGSQYAKKNGFSVQTGIRGLSDPRSSFLDLGTGSGILAIAAAKLGYAPVLALDFDPAAVHVARANARANRVHQKIKIQRGDVTKLRICPGQQRQQFDLVCANLISDLLIAERRRIVAQLKHSGTLVLAGILKAEFAEVQRAYEAIGLKLVSGRSEKEWRSGSFWFRH